MRLIVCVLMLLTIGCGSGQDKWERARPRTTEVNGVVLLDGAPLDGATVNLIAVDGKHSASGLTDASGEFKLTTFVPGDGAVPGKYQVTISKRNVDYKPNPEAPFVLPPLHYKVEEVVPTGYNQPATSTLTAEVEADKTNELSFEVSSKGPPM